MYVTVRYPQLGSEEPAPLTGPAADALCSVSTCGNDVTGTTTFGVAVEGADEESARAEGVRLADEWARAYGITEPGEVIGFVPAAVATVR